jgi:RNA polymerase sigma factor (TIGR02999 family)
MSMGAQPQYQITQLLEQVRQGDREARAMLAAAVYPELKRAASERTRRERPNHTFQPTALVNEAFLRLIEANQINSQNRSHFFAIAAELMRQILVDYARRRLAAKRGGGAEVVAFEDWQSGIEERPDTVIELDRLITRLSALDRRQAQVVELRYFSGLSEDEIAEALGISPRTVRRDWNMARAWMKKELSA